MFQPGPLSMPATQFRAKYHVLRKNVVEKVLKLLRRRERWLVVAGVRFLRTCIGTKDDFYMRYLVRWVTCADADVSGFWLVLECMY